VRENSGWEEISPRNRPCPCRGRLRSDRLIYVARKRVGLDPADLRWLHDPGSQSRVR